MNPRSAPDLERYAFLTGGNVNRIILVVACASLLSGCVGNPIKSYDNLTQNTASELNTHIGGQVFKVDRSTDLPNAFGKADIFGGKVNKGYSELRYQGVRDNKLVFRLTEIETVTNETTMSRYGGGDTTYVDSSSRLRGNRVQTTGTITTVSGPQGSTEMLPPNTTEFFVDPSKKKEITIAGVRVLILDYDDHSLRYMLAK